MFVSHNIHRYGTTPMIAGGARRWPELIEGRFAASPSTTSRGGGPSDYPRLVSLQKTGRHTVWLAGGNETSCATATAV